jgi:hypothetical protein
MSMNRKRGGGISARRACLRAVAFSLLLSPAWTCLAVTRTATTSVTVNIGAEASVSISSPTSLTQGGGGFVAFLGSSTVTFSIRTTKVGGSGSILLLAAEFAPAGGPTVASGSLTYTCGGAPAVGTLCLGTQTASTSTSTPVVSSIGANQKVANTTATVSWTLADSPLYSTGAYSAAVKFTVTSL